MQMARHAGAGNATEIQANIETFRFDHALEHADHSRDELLAFEMFCLGQFGQRRFVRGR